MVEQIASPLPRRGRPPRISQDKIVEAAIHLGLGDFSMQGVAAHLGVTPPALYTHVKGRDEVLALVAADLVGRMEIPACTDWRQWLVEYARQVRRHLASAVPSIRVDLSGPLGAHYLGLSERGLQLLIDAGLSPGDAGRALWLVFRVASTAGPTDDASVAAPMAEARRVGARRLPATTQALDALAGPSDSETFEFDLALVLSGLEERLRAR